MQPREVRQLTEKQAWLDARNAERDKRWRNNRELEVIRPTVRPTVRAVPRKKNHR